MESVELVTDNLDEVLKEQRALRCYYYSRQNIDEIRERSVTLPFLHSEIEDNFVKDVRLLNVGKLTAF